MEIKRELTALAKRMNPQVEVMNVASEIRAKIKRIDELITYAQTKIDRSAERKLNKEKTLGARADEERKAADKVIEDHQTAEAEENLKDQEESFKDRNKTLEKSQKPEAKKKK
jgi:hypothetical protein